MGRGFKKRVEEEIFQQLNNFGERGYYLKNFFHRSLGNPTWELLERYHIGTNGGMGRKTPPRDGVYSPKGLGLGAI